MVEEDSDEVEYGSLGNLTCPHCHRVFPEIECFAYDEGDFPDLDEATLFPGEVLEFPCGHSKEILEDAE